MAKVKVIGAGFSGLSLAYYLNQLNVPVEVFEAHAEVGGLIASHRSSLGLVETAANGLLATERVYKLFADLQLTPCRISPQGLKRWIYYKGWRRWPLGLFDNLLLASFLLRSRFGDTTRSPRPSESVATYIRRVLSNSILDRLVAPALQGIYAGDVEQMSADLVFSRFFSKRKKTGRTISAPEGMGQLIKQLERHMMNRGVMIHKGQSLLAVPKSSEDIYVVATAAWQAASLLEANFSDLAQTLNAVESLPLLSVTLFFDLETPRKEGFGVLMAGGQNFFSLGVLFNSFIFPNRSDFHSETWIIGGALNQQALELNEQELLNRILTDRKRLYGENQKPLVPLGFVITKWPKALPHYTLNLAKQSILIKEQLRNYSGLRLHGNYLGALGLSQILDRSYSEAESIKQLWEKL